LTEASFGERERLNTIKSLWDGSEVHTSLGTAVNYLKKERSVRIVGWTGLGSSG